MSFRSLFRGILAGGIAGFIGGVLMAPKKGEETRKELGEKKEQLAGWWSDQSEHVKHVAENIHQKKDELLEKISSKKHEPNEGEL